MAEKSSRSKKTLYGLIVLNFGVAAFWTVENFWINLYWVRQIDPHAINVSIMVSVTAIVGVITQIIFGALSDSSKSKYGRRRIFILWGSILGAICMMLFPISRNFRSDVTYALGLALTFDILITFFGEMATPPRMALLTDYCANEERGRVNAFFIVCGSAGVGLIMGMYFLQLTADDDFFYVGGALMAAGGIYCFCTVEDPPEINNPNTFKACFARIVQKESFNENRQFYYLLILVAILSFGNNIHTNFVYIYAESAMGLTVWQVGLIGILVGVFAVVFHFPLVAISDWVGRKTAATVGILGGSLLLIAIYLFASTNPWILIIGYGISTALVTGGFNTIAVWTQDYCPKKMRSSFLAYMNFAGLLPMAPGSILGGYLADKYASSPGIYSPIFFLVSAIVMIAVIPGLLSVQETIHRKKSGNIPQTPPFSGEGSKSR